eukprot:GHVN01066157.1.p1 GENE.GHVN01066157.1~~GHVN01066157.1.p1  ORF type:complete len:507 (+),score=49.67 GHVN01066157.1:191-1711(+)
MHKFPLSGVGVDSPPVTDGVAPDDIGYGKNDMLLACQAPSPSFPAMFPRQGEPQQNLGWLPELTEVGSCAPTTGYFGSGTHNIIIGEVKKRAGELSRLLGDPGVVREFLASPDLHAAEPDAFEGLRACLSMSPISSMDQPLFPSSYPSTSQTLPSLDLTLSHSYDYLNLISHDGQIHTSFKQRDPIGVPLSTASTTPSSTDSSIRNALVHRMHVADDLATGSMRAGSNSSAEVGASIFSSHQNLATHLLHENGYPNYSYSPRPSPYRNREPLNECQDVPLSPSPSFPNGDYELLRKSLSPMTPINPTIPAQQPKISYPKAKAGRSSPPKGAAQSTSGTGQGVCFPLGCHNAAAVEQYLESNRKPPPYNQTSNPDGNGDGGNRSRKQKSESNIFSGNAAHRGLFFKIKLCPWYQAGKCNYGEVCCFAHNESELRAPPNAMRMRMCPTLVKRGVCSDSNCHYAHNKEQLEKTPLYKTEVCLHHNKGSCTAGLLCRYAHGDEEIRKPGG